VASSSNSASFLSSEPSATSSPVTASTVTSAHPALSEKTFNLYVGDATAPAETRPLAFLDNDLSVPYISLKEGFGFLSEAVKSDAQKKETAYAVTLTPQGSQFVAGRENGTSATFDFDRKQILFSDFDRFSARSYTASSLDVTGINWLDDAGNPKLLKRRSSLVYSRSGGPITFDLDAYALPMILSGENGYLSAATFSDLFLSQMGFSLSFNGASLFLIEGGYGNVASLYYEAPSGKRIVALAELTYHELVFFLDHFYGLKAEHAITSFETFFAANGLKEPLLSLVRGLGLLLAHGLAVLALPVVDRRLADLVFGTGLVEGQAPVEQSFADLEPDLFLHCHGKNLLCSQSSHRCPRMWK